MRGHRFHRLLIVASVVALAAGVSAQSKKKTDVSKSSSRSSTRVVTLNGCISGDGNHYTLSDAQGKIAYRLRLSGTDVRDFLGQRVLISGLQPRPRRLTIVGGLYPSPNVAAQAGSINPVQAAEAASSASMSARIPEIDVKSVQAAPGTCEQP